MALQRQAQEARERKPVQPMFFFFGFAPRSSVNCSGYSKRRTEFVGDDLQTIQDHYWEDTKKKHVAGWNFVAKQTWSKTAILPTVSCFSALRTNTRTRKATVPMRRKMKSVIWERNSPRWELGIIWIDCLLLFDIFVVVLKWIGDSCYDETKIVVIFFGVEVPKSLVPKRLGGWLLRWCLEAHLPEDAKRIAKKELKRLKSLQAHHPEYTSTHRALASDTIQIRTFFFGVDVIMIMMLVYFFLNPQVKEINSHCKTPPPCLWHLAQVTWSCLPACHGTLKPRRANWESFPLQDGTSGVQNRLYHQVIKDMERKHSCQNHYLDPLWK